MVVTVYTGAPARVAGLVDEFTPEGSHRVVYTPSMDVSSGVYVYEVCIPPEIVRGNMMMSK